MWMGSGLFGDYGGTEGGVTTTEPHPQGTDSILHSLHGCLQPRGESGATVI